MRSQSVAAFVLPLLAWPFAHAHAELVSLPADVPEAAGHQLVYRLDVPVVAAYNAGAVPYAIDQAAGLGPFSRVAYHLQLEDAAGQRSWIYVSMRAFTDDATQLGVPVAATGVTWQRGVSDVSVRTNVPGVVTGDGLDGALEFWPTNYLPANGAGVPGASDAVYDFGDQPVADGGYGSMQIHAPGVGQVLFALNDWGLGTAPIDVGIGNCAQASAQGVQPDWTFMGNAGAYVNRRLDVYVVPGPTPPDMLVTLDAPEALAVYQRHDGNLGEVPIRGRLRRAPVGMLHIDARTLPAGESDGEAAADPTPFTRLALPEPRPDAQVFAGTLTAPAGWHRLEIRATDDTGIFAATTVDPVGVGEVFITAGQSNAANHGAVPLTAQDPRVSARGLSGWQHAADPQPVASGQGGSPWSALGDLLAARFDVPIGLLSVAVGGTTVGQWQPGAPDALYFRLTWALGVVGPNGARAVLWHQGESDASAGTTTDQYVAQLDHLIRQARSDAGWDVPFGVAQVGFLPGLSAEAIAAVVAGQQRVIDADPLVFEGPATDDLQGADMRYDGVHFSEAGLREHARRWAERIALPTCAGFADPDAPPVVCPDAAVEPPVMPDAAIDPDARGPAPDLAVTDGAIVGDLAGHPDVGLPPGDAAAGTLDSAAFTLDARASDAAAAPAAAHPVADCACRTGATGDSGSPCAPLLAPLATLGALGFARLRKRRRP